MLAGLAAQLAYWTLALGWIALVLAAAFPLATLRFQVQGRSADSWRALTAGSLTLLILLAFAPLFTRLYAQPEDSATNVRALLLCLYGAAGSACLVATSGALRGKEQRLSLGIGAAILLLLVSYWIACTWCFG